MAGDNSLPPTYRFAPTWIQQLADLTSNLPISSYNFQAQDSPADDLVESSPPPQEMKDVLTGFWQCDSFWVYIVITVRGPSLWKIRSVDALDPFELARGRGSGAGEMNVLPAWFW